eukprot:CAMPEP_0172898918 /NCGR_PEP_ID=MMETSP1075-20121228/160681_1 /TAXON_ID=2916 /ORGANISM="Ceratium fusus, Strain PA161109" /LENGTH=168 /DNA_ID=CAMNT_0013754805 /DNA_START=152 /DNA_END=656 /DNA_ORIENTATION=-
MHVYHGEALHTLARQNAPVDSSYLPASAHLAKSYLLRQPHQADLATSLLDNRRSFETADMSVLKLLLDCGDMSDLKLVLGCAVGASIGEGGGPQTIFADGIASDLFQVAKFRVCQRSMRLLGPQFFLSKLFQQRWHKQTLCEGCGTSRQRLLNGLTAHTGSKKSCKLI